MKGPKKIIYLIIPLLIIFVANTNSFADTISLVDGSVLIGKIVAEKDTYYLLGNSFGTFQVKKKYVKDIYVTRSYREDIAIHKKLGIKVNEEKIKKNYLAGVKQQKAMGYKEDVTVGGGEGEEDQDKKKKKKKKKRKKWWYYGRLGLAGTYFSTFLSESLPTSMTANEVLPDGISAQISYEQGMDDLIKKRHFMMPGFKFEFTAWMYFSKSLFSDASREISGNLMNAGVKWTFPDLESWWGCIVLEILPGITFLNIKNRDSNEEAMSYTFSMIMALGYEYQWDIVGLQVHLRYNYILDRKVAFHGFGGTVGVIFRLW